MALEILYFAWVREAIGADGESVDPPAGIATVGDLIGWLAGRGAGHAQALADRSRLRAAVDQRFAPMDAKIAGAREVAIFPPVTGGMIPEVRVQQEDIDLAREFAALEAAGGGGVASFTGVVRGGNGLVALELEHYPVMTPAAMREIAAETARRWPLLALTVVHRHGRLTPGERIVFVGAAATHRGEALGAVHFLIDWLKTCAPFWKREEFADRRRVWVEARAEDEATKESWGRPASR